MITLLTDFGYQDVYVGILHGMICRINPNVPIVDLTHGIPPQDCYTASFQLRQATPYFPTDTIHVVVVDPGVGSSRRGVAIQTTQGILVGPDNGCFTGVIDQAKIIQAVALTNSKYWATSIPSHTFHGRDIFAPVAAHLVLGIDLTALGHLINPDLLVRLPGLETVETPSGWCGHLQAIDHFGNLISTLPGSLCHPTATVTYQNLALPMATTYSDVPPQHPVALIGSHGWLEIALNQGHAAQQYNAQIGDIVYLNLS
jgi:hypothetical protein